jgi:hypothetical protein
MRRVRKAWQIEVADDRCGAAKLVGELSSIYNKLTKSVGWEGSPGAIFPRIASQEQAARILNWSACSRYLLPHPFLSETACYFPARSSISTNSLVKNWHRIRIGASGQLYCRAGAVTKKLFTMRSGASRPERPARRSEPCGWDSLVRNSGPGARRRVAEATARPGRILPFRGRVAAGAASRRGIRY